MQIADVSPSHLLMCSLQIVHFKLSTPSCPFTVVHPVIKSKEFNQLSIPATPSYKLPVVHLAIQLVVHSQASAISFTPSCHPAIQTHS